jgi:type VI secretion system protein ImpA
VLLPRDDLLNPLPNDSRGENPRQLPFYDKLREARKEDEDDTDPVQGERPRKKADSASVLKVAGEALATKSKDLELAVWLSEALVRKEGFAALPECLNLLHELQVRFWDVLYPQLDDGTPDLEFRATHLRWFAVRCDYLLRRIPLTKKGLGWVTYYDSSDTTREHAAMAGDGPEDYKRQDRDKAKAAREAAALEFGDALKATPKSFYVTAFGHLEAAQEALVALDAFCNERYGKVAPNFSQLRNVLEEIKDAVGTLLDKKRETEPDPAPQPAAPTEIEEEVQIESASPAPANSQPAATAKQSLSSAKLTTPDEAYTIVAQAAEFLRTQDRSSVTPYLLVRSLRWGELRSAGLDSTMLDAPPTEVRQKLKRLLLDCEWDELLSATEVAAALPCGRAWLDLHRYAFRALHERGYGTAAKAICSELKALIADFPALPDCMLNDDTPAANPETKEWLAKEVTGQKEAAVFTNITVVRTDEQSHSESGANGVADPFETALQLAKSHRFEEAIEVLTRQPLREHSGREKFLRRLQISQLCLATGQFAIAYPILLDLFSEIEVRKLLEWESTSFVVQPLTLLIRCIDKTSQGAERRSQIYNLLCRLEPAEALKLQNP